MTDKRAAARIPVLAIARCRWRGIVVEGEVGDASHTGLFVHTPRPLAAGTQAELELELPGGSVLRLAVDVARVEAGDGGGMGLRFAPAHLLRRAIANFLLQQHHSAR
jgi:hypothetical protein